MILFLVSPSVFMSVCLSVCVCSSLGDKNPLTIYFSLGVVHWHPEPQAELRSWHLKIINVCIHQHWKQRRDITAEDISLRELERWQQTTIFRLRTGHCQLLSHTYRPRLSHTHTARVELVFKTQNTSYKTAKPTHSKEYACGHLGLTSGTSRGGYKEELQTTAQFIENIDLQI